MTAVSRLLIYVLAGFVLVLLQMHAGYLFGQTGIRPDFILSFVVMLGISAPLCRGAAICWGCGLALESVSCMQGGVLQIFFLGVFFLIRLTKKFLQFTTTVHVMVIVWCTQLLKYGYLLFLFSYVYNYEFVFREMTRIWIFETILTVGCSPVIFAFLRRLTGDRKDPLFDQRLMHHGRCTQ
ncbi:MAG: hypothetical protein N3B18_02565 [Desulfobacterota bacterium]|nr:hypothetical protein [Thermodesulfobacteriota bacterium]